MIWEKDEAGFIAMHIISSELESNEVSDVQKMTELINAIIKIVKIHFRIDLTRILCPIRGF